MVVAQENILAGLQWLLGSVKESSGPLSLFFVFSGHGLRQPSADAAGEGQGPNQAAKAGAGYGEWEETILPSDYDSVQSHFRTAWRVLQDTALHSRELAGSPILVKCGRHPAS